jgi:hypothetical protein
MTKVQIISTGAGDDKLVSLPGSGTRVRRGEVCMMDIENADTVITSTRGEKRYALFTIQNLPILFYCWCEDFDRLPKVAGVMPLIDAPESEWYLEGYAAELGLPLVQWTVRQM